MGLFAGAPLNAGNRCRSAFALLFITCFSGLEFSNLKDLDLIPSSPCRRDARGRFAKGSSGNPRGWPPGIRNPRRPMPDLVAPGR